jgi:oligopeptide transport system substrate-binding protein
MVEEFSTKALLFESQQADIIEGHQDYTQKWVQRANDGEFKYIETVYPMLWWISFNQRTGGLSGLMNNAKIRLALSLSIDRDEFVELIYGRHKAAYSLIPFGMNIGEDEFRSKNPEPLKAEYEKYKGDDKALQNLFTEGLKELGMDKELKDITITFISSGTDTIQKASQEYYQQSWQNKLGIKVDLQVFGDRKLFSATRNEDKYDVSNGGAWHADYDDPMTFMDLWLSYGSWGYYFGQYNSPTFDNLFAQLAGEGDIDKRNEIYAKLEKTLIVDDAGVCPVYYEDSRNFVQNYVKNLSIPTYGPKYEFSRTYISGK